MWFVACITAGPGDADNWEWSHLFSSETLEFSYLYVTVGLQGS